MSKRVNVDIRFSNLTITDIILQSEDRETMEKAMQSNDSQLMGAVLFPWHSDPMLTVAGRSFSMYTADARKTMVEWLKVLERQLGAANVSLSIETKKALKSS